MVGHMRTRSFTLRVAGLCAALLFSSQMALAQFVQQGKLVGTGAVGPAGQGQSVALSADGNTAILGGPGDNSDAGAAWVFTRSGTAWSQQSKLVGTGAGFEGSSVALSADGNTAIFGGPFDNFETGAAWVFTRSGTAWTQQSKLVGTGAVGPALQGTSVALSADGNTAILGGWRDNGDTGAAWVFTRSGTVWTQQGSKLVGTGAVGTAAQGDSVALSSDGNTAIVGGPDDNSDAGAAWVFTRSGTIWTQQSKLVGTGAVGPTVEQGYSVALSSDGNTAILGGPNDNGDAGAAWVFTRSGTAWTQQGSKLVGTGAVGTAQQGFSVALSSDGNTAIVGGILDNSRAGAAWVFTRSGTIWTQQSKLVGTGAVGDALQGWSAALSGDGNTAILGGPFDNGNAGAAWVFASCVPPPPPPPPRCTTCGECCSNDYFACVDNCPTLECCSGLPLSEVVACLNTVIRCPQSCRVAYNQCIARCR
jgi:antibiotic biosynthesis monooxygenase (ABM) superfamily enzyme